MTPANKNGASSRRKFIRNAALAGAGFFIVPRHVLGRGYIAPSDKLNIAGIGVGGKGSSDLGEFAKSPFVNIVAVGQTRIHPEAAHTRYLRSPYTHRSREEIQSRYPDGQPGWFRRWREKGERDV